MTPGLLRVLVFALAAGCTSSSNPSADLARACLTSISGDVTAEESCTHLSLCHPTSNDYETISVLTASSDAHFEVFGTFAVRNYVPADFKSTNIDVTSAGKRYTVEASSVLLTVSALVAPTAIPCDGTAHGTASATLTETSPSPGPGRIQLALTF